MQWYPIPAVCALDMTVGGILYTAVPFNGWYASTEVLRDLTDESRYNMIIPIAKALGMDTETRPGEAPLYKDEVMHILSSAVYHSFKASKVAIIDHHNVSRELSLLFLVHLYVHKHTLIDSLPAH